MNTRFLLAFVALLSFSAFGQLDFFDRSDALFKEYVAEGKVDYSRLKSSGDLNPIMEYIENNAIPAGEEKAYLINVYNLFVMNKIVQAYPMGSPMDDASFFTGKTNTLNGEKISLDYLENGVLRKKHTDPRLHFVLVCGAQGCPPIVPFAYRANTLDKQLDEQTRIALNNETFVYENPENKTIFLSEIFSWYTEDFGKNYGEVISYINEFRESPFNEEYKVKFYPYNWTVNDSGVIAKDEPVQTTSGDNSLNLQQFTAGSLLGKGKMDFTLFNTLYTQNKDDWAGTMSSGYRTTFVTHLFQWTLGVTKNKRFNVGIDLNFRLAGTSVDSTYRGIGAAYGNGNTDSSRIGLSSAGIRFKFQPFKAVPDFSLQSTVLVPTIVAPEGRGADTTLGLNALHWADWNRVTWWNQFFYSKTFGGNKFQVFGEVDLLYRFGINDTHIGMLDVPSSLFLSYFPTKKITVYLMTQHLIRFANNVDAHDPAVNDWVRGANYTASGVGLKYQFMPNLNMEVLYTNFWRGRNNGLGETFNIGIKYITR